MINVISLVSIYLIGTKLKTKQKLFLLMRALQFSSVQLLSCVRLFATPWIAALQASLSITNSRSSLRLTSIESVMPFSHLILCRPLLLLPPVPPSIRVFFSESSLHMRWPKYWSFSFSIIPSKEIPGLIFRMDWLDLLAVQGTLKSLLQHHSSKASILWLSAYFTVQLSHPYMITGKTIALTRRTFVGKVMSLLFNMLSRLVITFFPRSKHLLISWQVVREFNKTKNYPCMIFSRYYFTWSSKHLWSKQSWLLSYWWRCKLRSHGVLCARNLAICLTCIISFIIYSHLTPRIGEGYSYCFQFTH